MPEGDTVWQTARRLGALTGQILTGSDFRVPSVATVDLAGRRVVETVPRGKHLLTRVEGGTTVHTHLRMEGRWDVQAAGSRWRRPEHQARVVLHTETHDAIGYSVILDVLPTAEEERVVGHLGPDLLGPDWDAAEALRRIAAAPEVSIAEALLDQRNLAGVGNVIKCEVLFIAGVTPFAPVSDVPDLPKVVDVAHRVLVANRDRPVRVTTGINRRGQEVWVYGRARQPCRRCGTPIAMERQGEPPEDRVTYWCPSCQPARA